MNTKDNQHLNPPWRSLDELAETEAFQRYLEKEFPHQAPGEMSPLSRREFFRVMGATLALAGVAGCSYQPPERIVPYVEQPEELIPGKPLYIHLNGYQSSISVRIDFKRREMHVLNGGAALAA